MSKESFRPMVRQTCGRQLDDGHCERPASGFVRVEMPVPCVEHATRGDNQTERAMVHLAAKGFDQGYQAGYQDGLHAEPLGPCCDCECSEGSDNVDSSVVAGPEN